MPIFKSKPDESETEAPAMQDEPEVNEILSGPKDPKPELILPDNVGEVTLPELGDALIPNVKIVDGRRVFVTDDSELAKLPKPRK
jgi:hypothetical protein